MRCCYSGCTNECGLKTFCRNHLIWLARHTKRKG